MNPGRVPHLKDDRLFECYLASRTGELLDPRDVDHLADCAECTRRYAELAGFMDGLRDEADAEIDAVFPPEQRLAQQERILRRLTHLPRSARVISFPVREVAGAAAPSTRVPPRWLVAAAAAGLFIGVAVGGFFAPAGLRQTSVPTQVASAPIARVPSGPAMRVNNTAELRDDDAFLMQLEVALDSPQLRELQPFDALTPHVREIGAWVR